MRFAAPWRDTTHAPPPGLQTVAPTPLPFAMPVLRFCRVLDSCWTFPTTYHTTYLYCTTHACQRHLPTMDYCAQRRLVTILRRTAFWIKQLNTAIAVPARHAVITQLNGAAYRHCLSNVFLQATGVCSNTLCRTTGASVAYYPQHHRAGGPLRRVPSLPLPSAIPTRLRTVFTTTFTVRRTEPCAVRSTSLIRGPSSIFLPSPRHGGPHHNITATSHSHHMEAKRMALLCTLGADIRGGRTCCGITLLPPLCVPPSLNATSDDADTASTIIPAGWRLAGAG